MKFIESYIQNLTDHIMSNHKRRKSNNTQFNIIISTLVIRRKSVLNLIVLSIPWFQSPVKFYINEILIRHRPFIKLNYSTFLKNVLLVCKTLCHKSQQKKKTLPKFWSEVVFGESWIFKKEEDYFYIHLNLFSVRRFSLFLKLMQHFTI